jgi:hypothetical protein
MTDIEIEITPAMMKAARKAHDDWYASPEGDTGPSSTMIAAVFRAMVLACEASYIQAPYTHRSNYQIEHINH